MIEEFELFQSIRQGEYSCLPKTLYNLLILVANNLQQNTLVIHSDRHPTVIEAVLKNYSFKGVTTELQTNDKEVESLFKKSYVITVNVSEFLSSIQSFNQIAIASSRKSGARALDDDALLAQEAKRQQLLTKQAKEKENENMRIIYKREIKDVKPIPYKKNVK